MSLSLERLAETTKLSIEELDNLGIPLTCDKGHAELVYTPTTTEVMVECSDCGFNDVCFPKEKLRLH